jgi:hypothetical protein
MVHLFATLRKAGSGANGGLRRGAIRGGSFQESLLRKRSPLVVMLMALRRVECGSRETASSARRRPLSYPSPASGRGT